MGINIKAALLSGLVLPGLGQLYKGCRMKGIALIVLVNIFLMGALLLAMEGVGKIIVSAKLSGSPDMGQVLESLRNDTPAAKWLLACFFCIWVYGIADALFTRGNEDRKPQQS
jgi:hypothetical protein